MAQWPHWVYIIIVLAVAVFALRIAWVFAKRILAADSGSEKMQEIARAIREGAEAFLKTQYRTIAILAVACALLLWALYYYRDDPHHLTVPIGFLFGAACSAVAGILGMWVSVRANLKTAHAATRSLNEALQLSIRGGAVSGIAVVALSLIGVTVLFVAFGGMKDTAEAVLRIVGFAFGASFVALFAQLGGGIYTKAADVGADLVGKVEKGIPEDDPRNPAVVADLVGDNVGDCAGRGADLFESTAAENIGAMILGVSLAASATATGSPFAMGALGLCLFPLVARAFGLLGSIWGVTIVKVDEEGDPMGALTKGFYNATFFSLVGFLVACLLLLRNPAYPAAPWWFYLAGVIGIANAVAFLLITMYYTEYRYRPVKAIAQASTTGPATNIITGLAVAFECTALPVISVSVSLILAYWCGVKALPGVPGAGLFGTAIATMGMLAPAAFILAMDTFGPIADNAGGIVEMSKAPENIRRKMDRLDAVGNTTKALTKGYAIGSAALAAFLLFRAYLDEVQKLTGVDIGVDLTRVPTFIGGLLGAALVFLFSAFAIRAVGRAAQYVIEEVRRQFKADPGIMAGTSRPDYGRCVDIVTKGALKEMILPGLLAVLTPVAVGVIFRYITLGGGGQYPGAEAVAAVLMVGTIAGILLATVFNNGGGAWDNAKKWIETGQFGGKGSESHKAAVVGDTVGDPLKDTAGPSIHVLIKLLATVTLVLAPLFI